jgi:hypothetical protein
MEQRFSLEAAGKLFGISTNAMRSRAKKNPEKYHMERDNGGKIWLWFDPENLPAPKTHKASLEGSKFDELKASVDALKVHTEAIADLREGLATMTAENGQLRERLTATEADRDRWQSMAEKLADRPRRGWWPWGRS